MNLPFRIKYYRYRASPVSLARYTPISQSVVNGQFATCMFCQILCRSFKTRIEVQTIKWPGIAGNRIFLVNVRPFTQISIAAGRSHNFFNLDSILPGKFPVSLVMSRNRHNGTCTVGDQHEICHINRNLVTGYRVNCRYWQQQSLFFHGFQCCF